MKLKRIVVYACQLLCVFFLLIAEKTNAQESNIMVNATGKGFWIEMMQNHDLKFSDVQNAFYKYWAGRSDFKGNGYKVFKRWEYINESRVLPDGKLQAPDYVFKTYKQYIADYPDSKSASGTWTIVAPTAYPVNNTSQPTGMGRINAIAFDPTDASGNTIFIGSPSGGCWKTTDHGANWTDISSNIPTLGVSSLLVDPANPATIYLGSGDRDSDDAPPMGVFKSTDGGLSWTQINNTMGNVTVNAMVMNPADHLTILAATSGGVYKTTNGGATWSAILAPGNFKDIKLNPGDPAIVYAVTSSGSGARFYRSANSGTNWSHITTGIPNAGTEAAGSRMVIGVSPANPACVYLVQILQTNSRFQALLRSTDSGLSFSTMSTSPNIFDYACDGSGTSSQATYDLCITADPNDANTVYVGSINNWKSIDGGASWTLVSHWASDCSAGLSELHADQHCYEWNNGKLYVGHDGGISYTTTGGSPWTEITNNLAISQIYKIGQSALSATTTLMGLQDNGSNVIFGGVLTTTRGGDGTECAIDYADGNYCYNTYVQGDISRSTTGPTGSYSNIGSTGTNGIGADEDGAWVTPYFLHRTSPGTMFAGYKNVWRTTNVKASPASAVAWSAISTGETSTCKVLEQSPANVDIIYVARSGSVKRTDNANADAASVTWISCALPGGKTPSDIKAHPANENIVYATAGYSIFKSTDKGLNWTDISGNLPLLFMNCLVIDKNANEGIYIGNQTGVWYKDANMADWVMFSSGLPVVDIRELEIFYDPVGTQHRLKAATYGRGLWESDLIETGVLNPTDFAAVVSSNTQIDLSWALSSGNNVLLAYNTSPTFGSPVNGNSYSTTIPGGGKVLSNGSNTTFNHTLLNPNTTYYYKIWSYDGSISYSAGATVNATTTYSSAEFTCNTTLSCTGALTVNFTDASIGTYNSWAWDIDNNGTTDYTTQNPTHTYNSPGLYSVKLTVNNGAANIVKENMILVMDREPSLNTVTGCALASNSNSGNGFGIGIYRFALGNIDYSTSNNDGYYQNYTCSKWTTLELNKSYNITIRTGTSNSEGARVYIDYNDNGIFDAGESVASFPSNKDGTRTLSFTTPSSGVVLDKGLRLRVLSKFSSIPGTACDIGSYGQAEDYTVYFTGDATWTGITSSDWHTPGNWSNHVVPVADINAIIPTGTPNNPVVAADVTCKNLTIQSGASLTVNPGKALTVSGNLTNNAGTSGLLIKSDVTGTGSLIHSTVGVPATVERYIAAADWVTWNDGWHQLASPVNNHPIAGPFTVVPESDYDFYAWSEPDNLWINFKETGSPDFAMVNGSNTFKSGTGYLVAYKTADTKLFTGNLNVADVAFSDLTLSSGGSQGWHLLGNPFASAINWYTGWTVNNIGGVACIWNEAGQSYMPRSAGEPIPQANGFMVQVLSQTGALTIPASARIHNAQGWYKSTSYPVVSLFAHNTDYPSFQESQLRFNPEATGGFDNESDGNYLPGYAPQFYSACSGHNLMVNSLPYSDDLMIPFNFIKNEGDHFRIEAAIAGSLSSDVYLLDKQTGTDHNLSQHPVYHFESAANDNPDRFLLHFKTVGVNEPVVNAQIAVVYTKGTINIRNMGQDKIVSVSITDMAGQSIYNSDQQWGNTAAIGINASEGVYLVFVETETHFFVKKLLIY